MTAKALSAAIAAAVAAGAVSGAMASIRDGAGVIHGCYSTLPATGRLRVIDPAKVKSCGRNETPLDWNRQGRQGATGPAGPTGPAGATAAWFKEANGTAPKSKSTLLSLSLPAGTFAVTLTGDAVDAGADGWVRVQCNVSEASGIASSAFVTGQAASLAASGVVSLGSPGTLDVQCFSDPLAGSLPDAVDLELSAIQTDNAHVE